MHGLGTVTSSALRGHDFFEIFKITVLSRLTVPRGLFSATPFVLPFYCESKMGSIVFVPLTVYEKMNSYDERSKIPVPAYLGPLARSMTPPSKFPKLFFNLLINPFCDDFYQKIPWHEVLSVLHKELVKYAC